MHLLKESFAVYNSTSKSCVKTLFSGENQPCKSNADCLAGLACDSSPFGNYTNTCRKAQNIICVEYADCVNRLECGNMYLCGCVSVYCF